MSENKSKAVDRRAELDAWFVRHRIRKADIAQQIGVTRTRFSQLLQGIYLSPAQRQAMVEAGVPDHLLPRIDL